MSKKKTIKRLLQSIDGLTVWLLEAAFEWGELMPDLFDRSAAARSRIRRHCIYGYPLNKIRENIKLQSKRGNVAINQNGSISLTKKGLIKILAKKIKTRLCDRKHQTIVIFDINETKRGYRKYLRKLLISKDFKNIQKSVMVGNHVLSQEFYALLKEMALDKEVRVLTVENCD